MIRSNESPLFESRADPWNYQVEVSAPLWKVAQGQLGRAVLGREGLHLGAT